jgi:hypothetical protein
LATATTGLFGPSSGTRLGFLPRASVPVSADRLLIAINRIATATPYRDRLARPIEPIWNATKTGYTRRKQRGGPVGAEEEPRCYRHDSGISISWAWSQAPRQNVTADVLARLVAPGRHLKRVSLQYRPFSAAEATRVLEAEVNAAQFRARDHIAVQAQRGIQAHH